MSTKENTAGIGVSQRYGARTLPEGKAGVVKTHGSFVEIVLHFDGAGLNGDAVETPVIPAGFKPVRVIAEVDTAGSITGTTPTIVIGTNGSEATNGFSISEAQIEAAGAYVITSFNGTWANQLAAATTIGVALGGTTPVLTGGEYKVTIEGYLA